MARVRRVRTPSGLALAVALAACGSPPGDEGDSGTVGDETASGTESSETDGDGGEGDSGDGDGTSGDGDGTSGDGDGTSGDGDGDGTSGDGDGDGTSGDGDGDGTSGDGDGDGTSGGGDGDGTSGDGDGDGTSGDGDGTSGDGDGTSGDGDGDGDGDGRCDPLPAPSGMVVDVSSSDDFASAVAAAAPGTTVRFSDGTYAVPSSGLWPGSGVTLRSASGDPSGVVLDGNYQQSTGGIINVLDAPNVTVAELSIIRPRFHGLHVSGGSTGFSGYRIRIVDPGEQAFKVNVNGAVPDAGDLACSELRLSDSGRQQVMMYTSSGSNCYTGGVDAHAVRDWVVRDNYVEGFWCSNGDLSEHGIHFWQGARDTVIERNTIVDCARGIGFGLTASGRTYSDNPCPSVAEASHYGGVIRNNLVVAKRPELFASPTGFDNGISLAYACQAAVVHNTVASTDTPFNSIEWRFPETTVDLVNNLVTHNLLERNGATAIPAGNIESAPLSMFVDVAGGDAHLDAPNAGAAIDQGDPSGAGWVGDDVDGEARDASPDVGADEI